MSDLSRRGLLGGAVALAASGVSSFRSEADVIVQTVRWSPVRRVYYVDVGNTPPAKIRRAMDRIKAEMKARKLAA